MDHKPCDECRASFRANSKTAYRETPPCETCQPDVIEETDLIVDLYALISDQWIMGPNGLRVALNVNAIDAMMRRLDIEDEGGEIFKALIDMGRTSRTLKNEKLQKELEKTDG